MPAKQEIAKTKAFLKDSFVKNPSYSFNDWSIMYNHRILVYEFALKISQEVTCDALVLSIGALLHDVGKTYAADEETLRKNHGELGWTVSKSFLSTLNLTPEQMSKLQDVFSKDGTSVEKKIIKDADTLAFLADEKLQSVFKQWAKNNNLSGEFERKLEKAKKLNFDVSKELATRFSKLVVN